MDSSGSQPLETGPKEARTGSTGKVKVGPPKKDVPLEKKEEEKKDEERRNGEEVRPDGPKHRESFEEYHARTKRLRGQRDYKDPSQRHRKGKSTLRNLGHRIEKVGYFKTSFV